MKEMFEVIKTIGIFVVSYMFSFLLTYCEKSVSDWRKNGCKFKLMCKHEYDVESVVPFEGRVNIKCKKCGKKKKVKNLSYETVSEIWRCFRDEK